MHCLDQTPKKLNLGPAKGRGQKMMEKKELQGRIVEFLISDSVLFAFSKCLHLKCNVAKSQEILKTLCVFYSALIVNTERVTLEINFQICTIVLCEILCV